MVKTNKLKAKIIENDFTYEKLAPMIGITVSTLSNKVLGKRQFTTTEITRIREALHLTSDEICDIFFD